jgi:hypothetical protein
MRLRHSLYSFSLLTTTPMLTLHGYAPAALQPRQPAGSRLRVALAPCTLRRSHEPQRADAASTQQRWWEHPRRVTPLPCLLRACSTDGSATTAAIAPARTRAGGGSAEHAIVGVPSPIASIRLYRVSWTASQ